VGTDAPGRELAGSRTRQHLHRALFCLHRWSRGRPKISPRSMRTLDLTTARNRSPKRCLWLRSMRLDSASWCRPPPAGHAGWVPPVHCQIYQCYPASLSPRDKTCTARPACSSYWRSVQLGPAPCSATGSRRAEHRGRRPSHQPSGKLAAFAIEAVAPDGHGRGVIGERYALADSGP